MTPSSFLSASEKDTLKTALLPAVIEYWLPHVAQNFHINDFKTVWDAFEDGLEKLDTLKEGDKYIARWRAALKAQYKNLTDQQVGDIAFEALHRPDYPIIADCIQTLVKRSPNALNEWCQEKSGHLNMLVLLLSDAAHRGKISRLKIVIKHLNEDSKDLVRAKLLEPSSLFVWVHTKGDREFEFLDKELNLLSGKMEWLFGKLSKYPLDQLYDGAPERHSWFEEWKEDVNSALPGGAHQNIHEMFDRNLYLDRAARTPTPSRPQHLLHDILFFESLLVGKLLFAAQHVQHLIDDQCIEASKIIKTLDAQQLNLKSFDQDDLKFIHARATRVMLDRALPPNPERPRILKKM